MAIVDINVGSTPNDGTGDSIRDAFTKANDNFAFLDLARQNLTTGNLTANGNITLSASVPSYWTGTYYLNGVQIATVGTLFSGGAVSDPTIFQSTTPSTSNVTGAVTISGGLGVAGNTFVTALRARSIVAETSISGATLTIGGVVDLQSGVGTGELTTTGSHSTTGNIVAGTIGDPSRKRSVASYFGSFSEVTGTLQTAAQPNVTSLGTLTDLAVTGNISAANISLTWGQVSATKAVVTGNVQVGSNLIVQGATSLSGNITAGNINANIGTYTTLTVNTIPTVKSVTTKEYVTATVVGFAIGLGS
jgi:hypothetical protein